MFGIRRLLLAILGSALLVAAGCGGSSDRRGYDVWEAEGLWSGTTSSGTFDGVVLDTGEYWFIYGSDRGARGVVQGNGYFSRSRFVSDNGADFAFGFDRPFSSTLASVVNPYVSIDGDVYLASRLERFYVGYDREYDFPANLAAVVGRRVGSGSTLLSAGDFIIDIDAFGNFSAVLAGNCEYGGRVIPSARRNVFDITLSGLQACRFVSSARGLMLIATDGRLVIMAVTPDRRDILYATAQ